MSPNMAQPDIPLFAPQPQVSGKQGFLRKLLSRRSSPASSSSAPSEPRDDQQKGAGDTSKIGLIRRVSRKVVPGLQRPQTFKRQQSERRQHLAPVQPSPEERRAVSVDRRSHRTAGRAASQAQPNPRASAPSFLGDSHLETASHYAHSLADDLVEDEPTQDSAAETKHNISIELEETQDERTISDTASVTDTRSVTTSQYEAMIHDELERVWILNLSMHFRDRTKREKFFITYREHEHDHVWRRVTISLDYREAPEGSLEMDLLQTKYQRDKSAKIYKAIRECLPDIQFYDTVTNLKLETTNGRLHVHVVEDGNEIIHYPTVNQIRHLGCRRIKERDITFQSHMSGFVYKVDVQGHVLIKKEIPGPDTIDEFLYEVNALNSLRFSNHVIRFHGVVVDDDDEHVKGLLINFASKGALIDVIYENCKEDHIGLPWSTREKWARQIVQGLADIHESGFVQGDFTLSNIVIDDAGDAKIIDINRRGCPVGWEPPEATALIEANQRLSMYIGVKSDLYQLGMVLWGLAMLEDEPEAQGRPLILGPEINVPDWYRQMTEICLNDDPRMRLQASSLLHMFPRATTGNGNGNGNGNGSSSSSNGHGNGVMHLNHEQISVDDGQTLHEYLVDGYGTSSYTSIRAIEPASTWAYSGITYADNGSFPYDPYYYARGRSPPSPLPSNSDGRNSPRDLYYKPAWAANRDIAPSYSDSGDDDVLPDNDYEVSRQQTPTPTADDVLVAGNQDVAHPIPQDDAKCLASSHVNLEAGVGAVPPVIDAGHVKTESKDVDEKSEQDIQSVRESNTTRLDQGVVSGIEPEGKPVVANDETGLAETHREVNAAHSKTESPAPGGDGGKRRGSSKGECAIDAVRSSCGRRRETDGADHVTVDGSKELLVEENDDKEDASGDENSGKVDLEVAVPRITDTTNTAEGEKKIGTKVDGITIQEEEPPLEQTEAAEAEPEYVTSRISGITAPGARGFHAGAEQTQKQMLGGQGGSSQFWAHVKDAIASDMMLPTPMDMCPRQTSLPVSLTGIGSAHLGMNAELLHETGLMDDEFSMLAMPETVPTMMITTDAKI